MQMSSVQCVSVCVEVITNLITMMAAKGLRQGAYTAWTHWIRG